MKKFLNFILLHKIKFIILSIIAIISITTIIIVFVIKNNSKNNAPLTVENITSSQSSESEIDSISEESNSSNTINDINEISKVQAEIKPSTGSVLTAPEFSYNPEEDILNQDINPNKFGPQIPDNNTVKPDVKKVEITNSNVNVRLNAGTEFRSLGKVNTGDVFDYLGEKVGTDNFIWYNIKGIIAGVKQSGYVRSDYAKYKSESTDPPTADNYKFEKKDGKTYCYKNGQLLKGYADINGLRYYFNKETGVKESYTCIDVSKYQKDINWNMVKDAGIEYAIIRVGFRGYGTDPNSGKLSIDPFFVKNIESAKAAGIKCGVYFYSAAKDLTEAVEEANVVLNAIKGYSLDLPIAFDTELVDKRLTGLSAKQRTDNAIAFLKTVNQAGYKAMIYTYFNFYNNYLENSRLTDYTLWMAYYTNDSNRLNGIIYDGWQYTSDGSVSGITGRCDMNVIFESMISGNKNDNPLLTNKNEEDNNQTSSDSASNNSSEITSENSSEASSETNSNTSSDSENINSSSVINNEISSEISSN